MKTKLRVGLLLLSLCMVFVLTNFTNASAANGATNVTMTVDKETVNVGDTVVVVIENADLVASGFGIYLEFDSEMLVCTEITGADGDEYMGMYQNDKKAPWVTAQVADNVDDTNKDGIFSFGVAIGSNKQLWEGIVATLTFTAKAAGEVNFVLTEQSSGTDAYKGVAATTTLTIKEAAPACDHKDESKYTYAPNAGKLTHKVTCDCGEVVTASENCSFNNEGKCTKCGYECLHTNENDALMFTEGKCDLCGYVCRHGEGMGSSPLYIQMDNGKHNVKTTCDCGVLVEDYIEDCRDEYTYIDDTNIEQPDGICDCCEKEMPCEHSSFRYDINNDGTHTKYCNDCDTPIEDETNVEHTYEDKCTCVCGATNHVYFYNCDKTCMNCGELTNPDAAHSMIHVDAVAATCTAAGNIEHWYCDYCGCCWDNENADGMTLNRYMVIIPQAEHESDAEYSCQDGNCVNCGAEMLATDDHSSLRYVSNRNGTHNVVCGVCGETTKENVKCTGSFPTWECPVCGGTCDHANLADTPHHISPVTVTQHVYYYICNDCECSVLVYENHTGGTATCTAQAVCEACNTAYGAKDANNHTSTEVTYVDNEDGTHTKKHACCGAEIETVAHTYDATTHICACGKVETFTVIWTKENGDVVHTETVEYGKNAQNIPDIPYEKTGYTASWSHNGKGITENTTVTMVFTENIYRVQIYSSDGSNRWANRVNKYTTWISTSATNFNGVFSSVVFPEGHGVVGFSAQPGGEMVSSTTILSISAITNNAVYDAESGEYIVKLYVVVGPLTYRIVYWVDGIIYENQSYKYGEEIKPLTRVPSKNKNGCIVYTFAGWDKEIPATMPAGNLDIYATFTEGKEHTVELTHVSAKTPTCTEKGNVEYWTCGACGKYYLDATATRETTATAVLLAPSCSYSAIYSEGVEAGCHTNGLKEHWYCANCDVYYLNAECSIVTNEKNLVIPAENQETICVDNKNGTHTKKYTCCDTVIETVAHTYDATTHKCVCGNELFTLTVIDMKGNTHTVSVPFGTNILEAIKAMNGIDISSNKVNSDTMIGEYIFAAWVYANGEADVAHNDTVAGNVTVKPMTSANGWMKYQNGWQYHNNGAVVKTTWMEIDGAWYYFDANGFRAEGLTRVPYNKKLGHENNETSTDYVDANEAWYYFNANGQYENTKNGIIDGKYVVNGMIPWHPGFVEFEGALYYFVGDEVNGGNIMATGWVYATRNNVDSKPVGSKCIYYFGEDGKLVLNNGVAAVDNVLYYFDENHMLKLGAGLVAVKGGYIYVRSSGMLAIGAYYIGDVKYEFDENGITTGVKNGIIGGKYYVNGHVQYGAGLITYGDGYIYVKSSGEVATGTYWITKTNGLKPAGKYEFDERGNMLEPKDGIVQIDGKLYYYQNNHLMCGLGLIKMDEGYYYIRSNGEVVTGGYWITNTNGLMDAGKYNFGTDGKLITE